MVSPSSRSGSMTRLALATQDYSAATLGLIDIVNERLERLLGLGRHDGRSRCTGCDRCLSKLIGNTIGAGVGHSLGADWVPGNRSVWSFLHCLPSSYIPDQRPHVPHRVLTSWFHVGQNSLQLTSICQSIGSWSERDSNSVSRLSRTAAKHVDTLLVIIFDSLLSSSSRVIQWRVVLLFKHSNFPQSCSEAQDL